ncbi:autotransporter domain-containing protein [Pusillimonas sp. T7-7]|uniref:autotransporter outer membrane beta-barrel domain-containing protein n=1 Tax=Pusillimonas sp. (strain T7-7) TaxID=1007105 RepID=UPI001305289F|nr:autotransporter outer membrane beta-barrel domain-containing protein [Pusillimonas sp. T7-7]
MLAKHTGAIIEVNGTTVEVNGDHARQTTSASSGNPIVPATAAALRAEVGGQIVADNATIKTSGMWAFGVHADGADAKITTQNNTAITTTEERGYGAYATAGGEVELNGGSVTTGGFMAHAIYSSGAESKITANNVVISATGDASDGAWAYNSGTTILNGSSISVIGEPNSKTPHEPASGVRAFGNGTLIAKDLDITTRGSSSAGAIAGTSTDFGSGYHGTVELDNVSITTSGSDSEAAWVGYGSTLDVKNSTLVSQQSEGIIVRNAATVTIDNSTIKSGQAASLKASFGQNENEPTKVTPSGQVQTIIVGAGSVLTENNGTLLRVERDAGVGADGKVTLTLASGATASGDVYNYDDLGNLVTHDPTKTVIDIQSGAQWAGMVIDDKTTIIDDSSGEQTNLDTDGDVSVQSGGSQQFNGTTSIGGSASVGSGQQVSFNGPTTIGADLMGQNGSSTTFGGDTDIAGSITAGTGSTFSFSGPTTVGGNVAGTGATFAFSSTAPTTIEGNLDLGAGSSTSGGTPDGPVLIFGNAQVGDGSTLGGNLNIAGILSSIGGTLNPGNSIGAQTYGSLGELSGTTYAAEVNAAGQSDLITIASGNADLTGVNLTVGQENGNGGYRLNHDYTIVETTKADGISAVAGNKFASETLDASFDGTLVKLDAAKFGANTVQISLSADTSAIDAIRKDLSSNQNATLDGVISVAGQNASADAALQSSDPKDALNQLSGELHGSTQTALLNNSQLVTRTLSNRMRANLGAGMQAGAPTAQASGAVAGSMPTSGAYPLWAQVVGSWNELDDDGNAAKVKSDTAGLFIGADTAVGQGWRVGAALGFTDGEVKVNDRNSKSDVTSYTAALYGGNSWKTAKGQVNFLAGAAYTTNEVDSRRTVNVGGSQTLKADYDVNTTQLFTELGYAIPVGQASVVEPYLGLAWMSQKAKSFDESGGSAALHGDSQTDDVTTFTLGLRGATTITTGKSEARLTAGLGWRHAAGDVDATRSMSFIQGAGDAFSIAGAPIAKNAAVVDLGAEMNVGKNTALGLSYSGQFGDGASDNAGTVYVRVRF